MKAHCSICEHHFNQIHDIFADDLIILVFLVELPLTFNILIMDTDVQRFFVTEMCFLRLSRYTFDQPPRDIELLQFDLHID